MVAGPYVESDGAKARLVLSDGWTLPISIVRGGEGWAFDTRAGAEELRVRRVGRNELAVIEALHGYGDAQREYAEEDRDGDGVLEYARRFTSRPGQHDGLYWPTPDGEPIRPPGRSSTPPTSRTAITATGSGSSRRRARRPAAARGPI